MSDIAKQIYEEITSTINEMIAEMPNNFYLMGNVNFAEIAKEISQKYIKEGVIK